MTERYEDSEDLGFAGGSELSSGWSQGYWPGSGRALARRRVRRMAWTSAAIVGIGVLASLVAVLFVVVSGSGMIAAATDPGRNAQTRLPDGDFVLRPSTALYSQDRCMYRGTVDSVSRQVTVVGIGSAVCPRVPDVSALLVSFDVVSGIAQVRSVQ